MEFGYAMSTSTDDRSTKLIPSPVGGLPIDTKIQDYRIKGVVGEGGFAIVYLAEDVMLHREIAVKEYMPASLAVRNDAWTVEPRSVGHSETFAKGMRSFINEARLLARFKHPALVDVLRFWEENGTAYMAMPYYRGKTLREVFRQPGFRCDESWLRRVLDHLLSGLQAMHKENCFHRDISTDNIMMLGDGNPVLLDFGAARRIVAEPDQVATVILKPGFAPIEQYSDDIATAPQGPWTDIYALCAVCYLAISGRMPTTSVARIMRDPVIPLASMDIPGFSPRFLAAIDKGLAVRPEDRPQSLDEFRLLLDQPPSPVVKEIPIELPAKAESSTVLEQPTANPAETTTITPIPSLVKDKTRRDKQQDMLGEDTIIPALTSTAASSGKTEERVEQEAVLDADFSAPPAGSTGAGKYLRVIGIAAAVCAVGFAAFWGFSPRDHSSDRGVAQVDLAKLAESERSKKSEVLPPSIEPGSAPTHKTVEVSASETKPEAPPPPSTPPVVTNLERDTAIVPPGTSNTGHSNSRNEEKPPVIKSEKPPKSDPATPAPENVVAPPVARVDLTTGTRQGNVILNIRPWGKVIVDGRLRGTSPPLKSIQLPVGRHKLQLKHPLGTDYFTEIMVGESRTVEISHDFAGKPNDQP